MNWVEWSGSADGYPPPWPAGWLDSHMFTSGWLNTDNIEVSKEIFLYIPNSSRSDLPFDPMTVSRAGSELFGSEMQELNNQSIVYSDIRESDGYEVFYMQARFVTGLICYPIVCVFGLIGNILSILVMCQKQMTSSTNVYLLALAISDCIKLISDFLYFMVILLLEVDFPKGNKAFGFLYPYAHYIFNSSLCISAWLTVSVAVERYIYVCHPTKVKNYCSISRARSISTSVFLIMSLLAIPYAMRYRTIEKFNNTTGNVYYDLQVADLWNNDTFSRTYTWLQNFLRSIIPLCILIVLNTCIIYGIKRCRIGRNKSSRRHRITVMLVVVIIVFLVCITPDAIMSTFFGIGYYEEKFLQRGVREITDLLLLVNSACNFIIYCIFNTIFWRNFVYLFCRPCCGPQVQMEESQIRRLSLVGRPRPSLHVRLGSRKYRNGLLSEV